MPGPGTKPALDSELAFVLDDLAGLAHLPGMNQILAGFHTALHAIEAGQLHLDQTQTYLTGIANPNDTDLTQVLALLVGHLTNPETNPSLRALPAERQKQVRELGDIHLFETAEYAPRDCPNEAAGVIAPD